MAVNALNTPDLPKPIRASFWTALASSERTVIIIVKWLGEFTKRSPQRRNLSEHGRGFREHFEILEVESWSYRTSNESIPAERLGCLPAPTRNHTDRLSISTLRSDYLLVYLAAINPVKLQGISFIEVPHLIGRDPVPTTMLTLSQQEINRRQRGTH